MRSRLPVFALINESEELRNNVHTCDHVIQITEVTVGDVGSGRQTRRNAQDNKPDCAIVLDGLATNHDVDKLDNEGLFAPTVPSKIADLSSELI